MRVLVPRRIMLTVSIEPKRVPAISYLFLAGFDFLLHSYGPRMAERQLFDDSMMAKVQITVKQGSTAVIFAMIQDI
jgi:hypothetical protein